MDSVDPKAIRVEGAGGVGINVWDHGGEGDPLLLMHCTGTHGRIWDPLVPALRERFRVIAPDTRGHGDSEKPEDSKAYRWPISGDDLLAVIKALGLEDPVKAAGHSAGASHLCYAAWKRPETFRRVVLMDPIIGPTRFFGGPNPLAEISRRRKKMLPSLAAARARFSSKPPMNRWDPRVLDTYLRHGFTEGPDGSITLKCPGHIEAQIYEGSGACDVFEQLPDLPLDVLLITGEGSDVRHLAELQREKYQQVRFELLEDTGHFIPQEKPDEIAALIVDWFNGRK